MSSFCFLDAVGRPLLYDSKRSFYFFIFGNSLFLNHSPSEWFYITRKRPAVADRLVLIICFVSYDRNLFYFFADRLPFQGKDHVWCSFKKAFILFPTHTAFTMLQTNKLLFHFPTTIRTDFVVSTHIILPAYKNRPNLIHASILLLSADK